MRKREECLWSQLFTIKQYRENRLRIEIGSIEAQLAETDTSLEKVKLQRIQIIQQWRERSRQTQHVRNMAGVHELRHKLGKSYHADLQLQKENERLQAERTSLQQQFVALNTALKQCIVKQEKLKLIKGKRG